MDKITSKSQLFETLITKRCQWEMLLHGLDTARMDEPGAAGHWSVKDIVAHITAYERWLVEWLSAASRDTFPDPSPLDEADIERRNGRVHELTQAMPLDDVLSEACQTFIKLLKAIKALPDRYFDDPQSAEWFMKPYWTRMETVPEAVINLSADHYDEHLPDIRQWMETNLLKEN